MFLAKVLFLGLLFADLGLANTGVATAPDPVVPDVIDVFDKEYIHIDHQTAEVEADFPDASKTYSSIVLHFRLDCPKGKCDWWDRPGTLQIISEEDGKEVPIEILRFMTPYRVGGYWTLDLTHLRGILSGKVKFRVFIQTYVKDGHPNGNGWEVSANFSMNPGVAPAQPVAIIPLWGRHEVFYGDPAKSSTRQLQVELPDVDYSEMLISTIITGHGQGNLENCAEFCQKVHTIKVDEMAHDKLIWRADCHLNPINNQQGTWKYPRAGWCPGDIVTPWLQPIDVSKIKDPRHVTITYAPEPYLNTCRPDSKVCEGCAFDEITCEYDGGLHVEPRYWMSSYLVLMK
jgi:hypothetical protein